MKDIVRALANSMPILVVRRAGHGYPAQWSRMLARALLGKAMALQTETNRLLGLACWAVVIITKPCPNVNQHTIA